MEVTGKFCPHIYETDSRHFRIHYKQSVTTVVPFCNGAMNFLYSIIARTGHPVRFVKLYGRRDPRIATVSRPKYHLQTNLKRDLVLLYY